MAYRCEKINSFFKKIQFLSGAQLKYVAIVSMLIDHVNKALLYPFLDKGVLLIISDLFDIIGRIAFPLFCFMLIEGFFKTGNRKKYLLTLLVFGLISEVPFDMFTTAAFYNANWNNVLFTLALLLITIWIIDILRNRFNELPRTVWYLASIALVAAMCILSMILGLDYEYHAILIGYFFYLFHDIPILAIPFGYFSMYKEPWTLLGFALTLTYNGKRGKQHKALNYWFYPVHLLLLGLLRMWFGV